MSYKDAGVKDANDHTYGELLEVQETELRMWAEKLQPAAFHRLCEWTKEANKPASSPTLYHNVPRGGDLDRYVNLSL